jgi:hypothetical protein
VLPLLRLEVAVVGALDLAGFHEDLRRRAIDALLEACLPSVSIALHGALGGVLPVHDMAAVGVAFREVWSFDCLSGWWSSVECAGMRGVVSEVYCWRAGVPGCDQSGVVGRGGSLPRHK